ncbi:MAG: malate dehydrogenase [Polyangiales bacterium]
MVTHRPKIALIGSGNIGGELAALCAREELGDIVLFDIPEKESFAKGKALDLEQNGAVLGYDRNIKGSANPEDLAGTDVAIVTAGVPRKPGMSRDDLVAINLKIVKSVAENLKRHAPNAFVIVITNPLDAMVFAMQQATGFAPERVVGMAGVLDSARFQLFLARAAGVSTKDVRAMVLGGHGDTMVPVLSATTINGVPVTQLVKKEELDKIIQRTREGGGEIVKLMGTSAFYAPASAAVHMARAFLRDEKRLLPCAAWLTGQYGYKDMYIGVPCVIGAKGVEKIIEVTLSTEEKAMLDKSAGAVRELVEVMKKM